VKSSLFKNGAFTSDDWVEIMKVTEKMRSWDRVILDGTPALNYQQIRQRARKHKQKYGIKYVIVDYLQLAKGDQGSRKDLEVGSITGAMKALAKELEIPVIVLSQLNRKVEERDIKRPKMADLRESGSIEQDADVIIMLYRDEFYNKEKSELKGIAEAAIVKHRNGPTGTVQLKWSESIMRFDNLMRGNWHDYNQRD